MAKKPTKQKPKITPEEADFVTLPNPDDASVKRRVSRVRAVKAKVAKKPVAKTKAKTEDTEEWRKVPKVDFGVETSPSRKKTAVTKKDPLLDILKKIEKNTKESSVVLKEEVSTTSAKKHRKPSTKKVPYDFVEPADDDPIDPNESFGSLFKKNTRKAIKGFGKRVKRGISKLPENLSERIVPGPLGRILAKTFKQRRIARGAAVGIRETKVGGDGLDSGEGGSSTLVGAVEGIHTKLDSIHEEERTTNTKLDKLIGFAVESNRLQEKQNALLEEQQTEEGRKRSPKPGLAQIVKDGDKGGKEGGGGGGLLDTLIDGLGLLALLKGGKGGLGALVKGGAGLLKRGGGALLKGGWGLLKKGGGLLTKIPGIGALAKGGMGLLSKAGGGIANLAKGGMGLLSKAGGALAGAAGGAASTAGGWLGSAWGAVKGVGGKALGMAGDAGKWVGQKAMNLGLAPIVKYFKSGGPSLLGKLVKGVPVLATLIQSLLTGMEISNIKGDPTLSPKEKKQQIGERLGAGLGSLLGTIIGGAGGAALGTFIPIPGVGTFLGGLAGSAGGAYVGDLLGGALASSIGGEGIYDVLSNIPGLASLIEVPGDTATPSAAAEAAPSDVSTSRPAAPPPDVQEEMRRMMSPRNAEPAPVAQPSGAPRPSTSSMTQTNDMIDQASAVQQRAAPPQNNVMVNSPSNTSTMLAPMRIRDESISHIAMLNRVALG